MGKLKNLEKKPKAATEFDKKPPSERIKSINDEKLKNKSKVQKKTEGVSKAKKNAEIQKSKKQKKVKILTQIKQEVELNAKKIETKGISEDASKLVAREVVKKAIIALKAGITKETEQNASKNLFDDELRIGLQVIAVKIPNCPPHVKKIVLKHSLFEDHPDICFFIRDADPKKDDQAENIRAFQEKLDKAGVTCKKIMTITQLKQDYGTHNLKIKLCNLFDIFLVEAEIAEHVYSILGKNFIVKRKRPLQINSKKSSILKDTVDRAIRKVNFKLNGNSNISCFEIGTIKMDNIKIADNVMTAIEQLKEQWPGGWKNINRLYLKPMSPSKVSIPIFYSKINPNEVSVPVIKGDKVNRLQKLAGELKTKAKKLKLDIKTKKLVRVKEEKKPVEATAEQPPKKKSKKNSESADVIPLTTEPEKKKDKKKKIKQEEVETIVQEQTDEPEKKKKKKSKAVKLDSDDAAAISESVIEQQQAELEELPKKSKNKKKSKAVVTDTINEEDTPLAFEEEQVPKKKKKDKKNKA